MQASSNVGRHSVVAVQEPVSSLVVFAAWLLMAGMVFQGIAVFSSGR